MACSSRRSFARVTVDVLEYLDGFWSLYHRGLRLAHYPSTEDLPRPGSIAKRKPLESRAHLPSPNHPWRKDFQAYLARRQAGEQTLGDSVPESLR